MRDEKKTRAKARRDFLRKAVSSLGLAGAAAALSTEPAKGAAESEAKPSKAGYRESAHVKRFYRAARF